MQTLAKGKAAVLAYLEEDAQRLAGKAGVYQIISDTSGPSVFIIAGHALGSNISVAAVAPIGFEDGHEHLTFINGIVVEKED